MNSICNSIAAKIKMQRRNVLIFWMLIFCLVQFEFQVIAQEDLDVSFDRDIRPILSDRCFACHGPDADSREAGLRLDIADGAEGAHTFAIEPGSAEDSEVWNRITSDDESEIMPPPNSHKPRLTKSQQRLFRKWIDSGAVYKKFWAFEQPVTPGTPSVKNSDWSDQPIDLHVLSKLESAGQVPSQAAEDRILIRRVTLDLTGLPPTQTEIREFLEDKSASGDEAWERLIDSLLSRPQYGEHIARYWLDVVRFADTNGMHKDFFRNNSAYRDWVIKSFNENLGYDEFVRYQLAGDLFPKPTNDQLVASGFNRLHLIIDRGTALPEESFAKNVHDRVAAVSTGFMGLTVQCAQCHDHKYDPITQKDYYSLYAFFNNIDAAPETQRAPPNGLQQPFIKFETQAQLKKLEEFDRQLGQLDEKIKIAKLAVEESKVEPVENEEAEKATDDIDREALAAQQKKAEAQRKALVDALKKIEEERKALQQKRDRFYNAIPGAMVMKERSDVRETFVLNRGEYDSPGEKVERNTPGFLPPLNKEADVATRMDLANWLVDSKNPLTARVAVNRFWQQFFGVGLVKTSEDIGAQGEVPSHPELLDYLAVSFVESGWDVRSLVKQIVMSETYRQSSVATTDQFKKDPENRMLARGSRYRMDAEMIRDQILATSGLLSMKMKGASVKPPQPDGLWQAVTMTGQRFKPDSGEEIYRRSVYTFWKRAMPPPQMTILNAPIRDACTARRERTNTPSQALLLLNEPEYLKAARQLASQVIEKNPNGKDSENRIEHLWEVVTARLPDESEKAIVRSLLVELAEKYKVDPAMANAICAGVELESEAEQIELASWTIVANTIYNLDITKTKE